MDDLSRLKEAAKTTWAKGSYGVIARSLLPTGAHLVRAARVAAGDRVLDVACGTGVAAITARLAGANVAGLDLTPELLEEAKVIAAAADADGIEWRQGDAEQLPYADQSFDVVVSSFGHMFAPRPDLATAEMLRVLRPGGRIAFTTWPPEHATGAMFRTIAKHAPPPSGIPSPLEWGHPETVRQRLGAGVHQMVFERGVVQFYAFSPAHFWQMFSTYFGPTIRAVEHVGPAGAATLRQDLIDAAAPHFRDNVVHYDYLLTRAVKK